MSIDPGIHYLRSLRAEEREFIEASYQSIRHLMPTERDEIHWLNVFLNGRGTVPGWAYAESLHSFVLGLLEECYSDLADHFYQKFILNYGFIMNPAGATKSQQFHCDYSASCSNLFIPLTKLTLANSTQFISTRLHQARMDAWDNFGEGPEEVMNREGIDCVTVSQVVSKPYTLLRMNPNTPHRGIANSDNYDRILFFVSIDNHFHRIAENIVFRDFRDEEVVIHPIGQD